MLKSGQEEVTSNAKIILILYFHDIVVKPDLCLAVFIPLGDLVKLSNDSLSDALKEILIPLDKVCLKSIFNVY